MSQRTDAINNAYNDNQNGRTSFYYVLTSVLERLGIHPFKSQQNDNFIRVIPPKDPRAFWAREVHVHSNIGANRAAFLCLSKMWGKPCPVCEYIEQLKSNGASPEILKALYAKKRFLMFVFDVRDDSTIAKGLQWYDAPPKLVGEIISRSKDKRTKETIDVCDPKEGRDIEFVRKGQGLKTDYTSVDLKATGEVPPDWYENVPAFDEVLAIPTYEQVQAQLTGGVVANVEDPVNEANVETEVEQEPEPEPQPAPAPQSAPAAKPTSGPTPRAGGPTQRGTGGPTPRGASAGSNAATPAAAAGSVRDKINEIRQRRAQG